MSKILRFLGGVAQALRWAFMPLGLFALVAVGIHAGADSVDDRLLPLFDFADGLVDRVLTSIIHGVGGLFDVAPKRLDAAVFSACEFIGMPERATLARGVALGLELCCDLVLAFPALGWAAPEEKRDRRGKRQPIGIARTAQLALDSLKDPTILRLALPLATLFAAIAGSTAIAREMETSAFGTLRMGFTAAGLASAGSRLVAVGVLALVFVTLGGRAFARSVEHAFNVGEEDRRERHPRRRMRGLVVCALALPLAFGAALNAPPLLSFFR